MSTHEELTREHEKKQSSDRVFGLTFFVFFLVIALWPILKHHPIRFPALGISLGFLVLALALPALLAPLNRIWLKFGEVLHSIISPIILGVMFFLVITPIAVIMRLLGKDILKRTFDREAHSYWINREPHGPDRQSLSRQF